MTSCGRGLALFVVGFSLLSLTVATSDAADPAPVCERYKAEIARIARDSDMRFSFENDGGLANGGVCWWHSRFQRAVWYLADFKPELSKPTTNEAKKLINSLAHFSGVVEIPGYSNFYSFSADFKDLIQDELEQWQKRDGFINQAWIRGLAGKSSYTPDRARKVMRKMYSSVQASLANGDIPWVKLQMPGITSHAALILSIYVDVKGNYTIEAVDSNSPESIATWSFRDGDETMNSDGNYETMMPFADYERDMDEISRRVNKKCSRKLASAAATK